MRNLFLLCCLCFAVVLQAQVKIGNNPQLLSPSAVLELESTNKGFFPPRLTTVQRDSIATPGVQNLGLEGLTIYNLSNHCLEIWVGRIWKSVCEDTCTGPPAPPTQLSGPSDPIAGGQAAYSVSNIGLTQAQWSLPSNWSVLSGQSTPTILVQVGSDTGQVSVSDKNSCGVGLASQMSVNPCAYPGQRSGCPAVHPSAIRQANPQIADGVYWIQAPNSGPAIQAYCRFNYLDGGDWVLMLKVFNQGDMPSGSVRWTDTLLHNASDFNVNSGNWSKYATWNRFPFTRLAMEMQQGGQSKVPPIQIYNTARTFAQAIALAGGVNAPSNFNSTVRCDATDPAIPPGSRYWNLPMKAGAAFSNANGQEQFIQSYGIGMWAFNSANSNSGEGFANTGRAGAWIGCPLDDGSNSFNQPSNGGSDSGFGFGTSAGYPAKTTSCGYSEWNLGSSTNTLPGYVWLR
jgi:hypothetical protein